MEGNRLPDQMEQVELLSQRIWPEWLTLGDTMRIAERFGSPKTSSARAALDVNETYQRIE
jgi:hypothetical protein